MKVTTFFISETNQIYAKKKKQKKTVSESTFKVKGSHLRYFWKFCLRQQLFRNKYFLHENEIVQYLQNYKYQDINQGYFRKPLEAFTNAIKNSYPKTAHTFFTGRSIFIYFLRLNCYNFLTALTRSIKLNLEISL